MTARAIREFLKVARSEFQKYPNQYATGALFLWGISILLFSLNLGRVFLSVLYLLTAHILAAIATYVGFLKNIKNKRTPTAIALGLIILLLTFLMDALFIVSP